MKRSFITQNPHYQSFIFSLLMYSLLMLRMGYEFGRGDQIETLPYALYLQKIFLYENDFFISRFVQIVPNERLIFAHLLALGGKYMAEWAFFLQFSFSLVLLIAMEKIAANFIKNRYWIWLSIGFVLIVLYGKNIAGNEVYGTTLLPAMIANSLAMWGLYFFIAEKYPSAFLLFSLSIFFQPLVGFQPEIAFIGVLFWRMAKEFPRFSIVSLTQLKYILLYFSAALIWLLALLFAQKPFEGGEKSSFLFNIMYYFRTPHHYNPSHFPLFPSLMILFFVFILIAYTIRYKYKNLLIWLIITLLGMVIYTIGVEIYDNEFILLSQWFRISTWIKFLGVIISFSFIEKFFLRLGGVYKSLFTFQISPNCAFALSFCGIICSWTIILFFPTYLPWEVHFDILEREYKKDITIDICLIANKLTSPNALFIHPFNLTELQYYAQRSSYVDWKCFPRNSVQLREWARRIEKIYGLTLTSPPQHKDNDADNFFQNLSAKRISELYSEGCTHIITKKGVKMPNCDSLAANSTYILYEICP